MGVLSLYMWNILYW